MNLALIYFGKLLSFITKKFNLGSGSTWPGHIALSLNHNFIKQLLKENHTKIILVAGTNGKTTTSSMIQKILKENGKAIIHNETGANLLNGIASILINRANATGNIKADFAIFEIDENTLPKMLDDLTPDYVILLNLFRDQLDRYGEVHTIAAYWDEELRKLPKETTVIFNADDPEIANLGNRTTATPFYFGLKNKKNAGKEEHAADSIYCPNCENKLAYDSRTFSHLGDWECKKCGLKRPKLTFESAPTYPLFGTYNMYNTIAAASVARRIGINEDVIEKALKDFQPAFGRQEIVEYNGKKVQLFLSKNPAGFNESLRTLQSLGAKHILFILNDRIPDGLDVSWIWDVDFETLVSKNQDVSSSGDRAADMTLRLKYALPTVTHVDTYPELQKGAIDAALDHVAKNETLYILPTYSAMLEVRKIITGKKIL